MDTYFSRYSNCSESAAKPTHSISNQPRNHLTKAQTLVVILCPPFSETVVTLDHFVFSAWREKDEAHFERSWLVEGRVARPPPLGALITLCVFRVALGQKTQIDLHWVNLKLIYD